MILSPPGWVLWKPASDPPYHPVIQLLNTFESKRLYATARESALKVTVERSGHKLADSSWKIMYALP